ncbi:SRPBCC domain-containing protein [Streptomyces sp. NPDC001380]|uniref:SRPBCC family protein n=1 Tax=Streptomyces sp. NPDC001380 TaxID=3364566 RepID=UPI0036AD419E
MIRPTGPTRPTGLTRDAGFQIGVSRTLPLPPEAVWRFLVSAEGTALWLGHGAVLPSERGAAWTAADGTSGELRSRHEGSRVRLTRRPAGPGAESTVQVTVIPRGEGATVRFHQERLADAAGREERRRHWRSVMDALEQALSPAADRPPRG